MARQRLTERLSNRQISQLEKNGNKGRSKRAEIFERLYDNDPGHEKYKLDTSNNFQEDPEMGKDWQRDLEAYDEESHFMMPLDDPAPDELKNYPKMARLDKELALKKAHTCAQIARHMFPDGRDNVIEVTASDLLSLPDANLIALAKRVVAYNAEPAKVDAHLNKSVGSKAVVTKEALNPNDNSESLEMILAQMAGDSHSANVEEDYSLGVVAGDTYDLDAEIASALKDATQTNTIPDVESDVLFTQDLNTPDIDMQSAVEDMSVDAQLQAVFASNEEGIDVEATNQAFAYPPKVASRQKTASKNSNLKLSELMGNRTPSTRPAASGGLEALWSIEPDVEASFN